MKTNMCGAGNQPAGSGVAAGRQEGGAAGGRGRQAQEEKAETMHAVRAPRCGRQWQQARSRRQQQGSSGAAGGARRRHSARRCSAQQESRAGSACEQQQGSSRQAGRRVVQVAVPARQVCGAVQQVAGAQVQRRA